MDRPSASAADSGSVDDELHRSRGVDIRQLHQRPRTSATISAVVFFDFLRLIDRRMAGELRASRSWPWADRSDNTSPGGGPITAAGCPVGHQDRLAGGDSTEHVGALVAHLTVRDLLHVAQRSTMRHSARRAMLAAMSDDVSHDQRVSASRRIHASAADVFCLVADPAGHVRIDGSGMLEAAPDARPLTAVGQTFDMQMDRTPLNDIPGLVKYEVRNVVTRLEPDALIEWTLGPVGSEPFGHLYGWQLEVRRSRRDHRDQLLRLVWHHRRAPGPAPRLAHRSRRHARALRRQPRGPADRGRGIDRGLNPPALTNAAFEQSVTRTDCCMGHEGEDLEHVSHDHLAEGAGGTAAADRRTAGGSTIRCVTVKFLDPRAEPGLPVDPYRLGLDVTSGPVDIGLLANGFPDSVAFLDQVRPPWRRRSRRPGSTAGTRGTPRSSAPDAMLAEIPAECRAVVAAYGH